MISMLVTVACVIAIVVVFTNLFKFGSSPGVETFDDRESNNPFDSRYDDE